MSFHLETLVENGLDGGLSAGSKLNKLNHTLPERRTNGNCVPNVEHGVHIDRDLHGRGELTVSEGNGNNENGPSLELNQKRCLWISPVLLPLRQVGQNLRRFFRQLSCKEVVGQSDNTFVAAHLASAKTGVTSYVTESNKVIVPGGSDLERAGGTPRIVRIKPPSEDEPLRAETGFLVKLFSKLSSGNSLNNTQGPFLLNAKKTFTSSAAPQNVVIHRATSAVSEPGSKCTCVLSLTELSCEHEDLKAVGTPSGNAKEYNRGNNRESKSHPLPSLASKVSSSVAIGQDSETLKKDSIAASHTPKRAASVDNKGYEEIVPQFVRIAETLPPPSDTNCKGDVLLHIPQGLSSSSYALLVAGESSIEGERGQNSDEIMR